MTGPMEANAPDPANARAPNPVFQPHRGREPGRGAAMLFLDVVVLVGAMAGAIIIRGAYFMEPFWYFVGAGPQGVYGAWSRVHTTLLLMQLAIIPMALFILGQYQFVPGRTHRSWSFERIVAVVGVTHVAALMVFWLLRIIYLPRTVVILDFMLVVVGLSAWRWLWTRRIHNRLNFGQGLTHVLFVGIDPDTLRLASEIVRRPHVYGRRFIGFIGAEGSDAPLKEVMGNLGVSPNKVVEVKASEPEGRLREAARLNAAAPTKHLIGVVGRPTTFDLERALDSLGAEEVYVASTLSREFIVGALRVCVLRGVDVSIVPSSYPEIGPVVTPTALGEFAILSMHRRQISRLGWIAKRIMDLVGGLVGSLLGLPLILAAAVAIKIENPSLPIFYRGTRVGYKGRQFKMWKLNTMVPEAQILEKSMEAQNRREGPWFKVDSAEDVRLTKVGRVLRKFTLNELPQFWNVLTGEMSLVGPRPPIPSEVATYLDFDSRYYRCLDAKPGMTSLWAVEARNDPSFDRRLRLDLEYLDRWTLWLDISLLLRTFGAVFLKREE